VTGASRGGDWFTTLDSRLQRAPGWIRALAITVTIGVLVAHSLPNVPRQYVDFSDGWFGDIQRYDEYGPDSLSDMYGTRVILNDPLDMFTKARTEQTPQEAATWSRDASAPYPPVVLLAETGLASIGERTGVGFYGMILGCAIVFVASSLVHFLRTRWYLFPLLYLNADYITYRFVYVQDNTYLVMLVTLMAALWLARAGRPFCHAVMAVAATMKLSPLGYAINLFRMPPQMRLLFLGILVAGLVLPWFVWDNYLYIYRYGGDLKGDSVSTLLALAAALPFTAVLWYVQERRGFDLEDRVGWGLVPVALLMALKMNVARHLLLVLLVPDKRGLRNVAAAAGLLAPVVAPLPFNASLAVATTVLAIGLVRELKRVGWDTVRRDASHPWRTLRSLMRPGATLQN
jgi:hypothetical protein